MAKSDHPTILTSAKSGKFPSGHPNIKKYMGYATKNFTAAPTPWWHPNINQSFTNKVVVPTTHPQIQSVFSSRDMFASHTNVDSLIRNPAAAGALPYYHPDINQWVLNDPKPANWPNLTVTLTPTPTLAPFQIGLPPNKVLAVPFWHPKIQDAFLNGWDTTDLNSHPLVDPAFRNSGLPSFRANASYSHPNLDSQFATKVNVSLRLKSFPVGSSFHDGVYDAYIYQKPEPTLAIAVPWWHPDFNQSYTRRAKLPAGHPPVHNLFVPLQLPSAHTNIDTLLQNPATYGQGPVYHPNVSKWMALSPRPNTTVQLTVMPSLAEFQTNLPPNAVLAVPFWHPNIHVAYTRGWDTSRIPGHPQVDIAFRNAGLPGFAANKSFLHPNIDSLFGVPLSSANISERNADFPENSLPPFHADLYDKYIYTRPFPSGFQKIVLPFNHPDVMEAYRKGKGIPDDHPDVRPMFASILPDSHPDLMALSSNPRAIPLPPWHPEIDDKYFIYQGFWSAGVILAAFGVVALAIMTILRYTKKCIKASRSASTTKEITLKQSEMTFLESAPVQQSATPKPPPRDYTVRKATILHEAHRGEDMYDYQQFRGRPAAISGASLQNTKVFSTSMPQKANTRLSRWNSVCCDYRILKKYQWTMSNVWMTLLWVLVNIACIFLSDGYASGLDLARCFGSLAASNTMFLVMAATKNSILAWALGRPFDHVIVYHRLLGRITLLYVLLHFIFFLPSWQPTMPYLLGLGGGLCGLVIFLTTFDYIRRRFFNAFFFAHYSFIGFFILAFLHAEQARPFIYVAAGMYVFDRFLRTLWMLIPRRCRVFVNKGEFIACVKFPKNPMTSALGMHKVGQYFFVNFPQLSLTEWHPFSVSNGPGEDVVELNIRALGDHTKEIVALAKDRVANPKTTWIRTDGPYGVHDFNYRRYPVLFLVGGGVGITPVMGILKDLYRTGSYKNNTGKIKAHCIQHVYALWVMPTAKDYACFEQDWQHIQKNSALPHMPALTVQVYATKAKAEDAEVQQKGLIASRPNFSALFEAMERDFSDKAVLAFTCGPSAMVNEIWDLSIKHSAKGQRFDFQHEIFEF